MLAPQVELTFAESDRAAFTMLVQLHCKLEEKRILASPSAYARIVQIISGLLQQFGCTPASRGRVAARKSAEEAKDPAESFLFAPKLVVNKPEG
jgi:hypothetical protein